MLESNTKMVQRAFIHCGISISLTGCDDHLIRIKDIPSSSIDFTGWEISNYEIEKTEVVKLLCDEQEMLCGGELGAGTLENSIRLGTPI